MLSFVDSKSSSAKLAEWSPSDWPESLPEMRTIDNLLRCSICYEYFDVALIVPDCSHNYCSLCIRRSLSYEAQCPTCSLKVNPPSLKNNRVLDELVKNFIKVRTKLLELVKSGSMTTCHPAAAADKEGDEVKNKSSLTSTKRRKVHARPQKNSKSSSPDTKRQKLDEGNELISNPAETTANIGAEESCSGSTSEVVVIETEEAECPVCGDMIPHRRINSHLDTCLTRTEKKSSLRRKTSREPTSICSTSIKRKHPPSLESKECDTVSSDDSLSCANEEEPCSSKATSSSSSSVMKGSNALIQTVQKRKALPKLVYSVMPEKELRQRLKEWNLSTKGDKASLVRRHQDFVMLYNAQCDSTKPKTAAQIAKEVEKAEKTRAKEASSLTEASTSGLRFDKNQSEEDRNKARQKYLDEHDQEFDKLIADIKKRRQGKRKKTATKPSACESLDLKKDEPGDDLAQSENNESRNTKGSDGDKEISDADTEMHPSFLMVNDKDSSTVDKCKSSSIIPEPPSSPSLASLPDEDDELTPSLGLANDDWDCKDEDSRDPNIIPESPVIKIGKAANANIDEEAVSSDSDEEFQPSRSSVRGKRIKSNLL